MENKNVNNNNEEEIKFLNFLVGIRDSQEFQVQTNVEDCSIVDYVQATAGIDLNVMLAMLRNGNIDNIEEFLKMKEITLIAAIKNMAGYYQFLGITEEQYEHLRKIFYIDELETSIKEMKEEKEEKVELVGFNKKN